MNPTSARKAFRASGIPAVVLISGLAILAFAPPRALAQVSPHGKIKFQCEECHSPANWKEMKYPSKFNHKKTGFTLSGQHVSVECTNCHTSLQFAVSGKRCADCHKDVHRGELGAMCERCHTSDSWLVPDMTQRHSKTRFALVGAHATAQCQECHKNTSKHEYVGLRTDCVGCHKTEFESSKSPNHRTAGFSTDCVGCHAVNASRWGGSFDHAKTGFPLVGAHAATACVQCHAGSSFRGTTSTCVNCHRTEFTTAKAPSHTGFSNDCTTCHTLTGWHPAAFDHAKTNFPLQGAHQTAACQDCHKNSVFKGTVSTCQGCHQTDFTNAKNPSHAGFSTNCQTCHTLASWHPASFDHSKTNFPLAGAHMAVTCQNCHKNNVYAGTSALCSSCHQTDFTNAKNPSHAGFSTSCQTCHSVQAWHPASFDHNKTLFPLQGSHVAVPCLQCHVNNVYKGTSTTCFTCHQSQFTNAKNPPHTGYPTDCTTCHTAIAWAPSTFDHSKTNFPLQGAHTAVTCQSCHKNNVYAGTSTLCSNCHQTDFANAKNPSHAGFSTTCQTCHTVTAWRPASFDHNKTLFPLQGSHVAVPCLQCHVNNVYKGTSTVCFTCHQTDFTGAKNPAHTGYPTDCMTCHTVAGWRPSTFDHSKTAYPLVGAHMAVPCQQCHVNNVYKGTSTVCFTCHQADFTKTTSPSHVGFVTDCATCHTMAGWRPATFDHNKTAFPLTGAHITAICAGCHKNNVYKGTATLCYTCHQQQFITAVNPSHAGFPNDCKSCHSTAGWRPASFDHSKTNFALTGAHQAVACTQCHKNNVYAGTTTLCFGCHQADYTNVTNPKHAPGFSTDCMTCHTTAAWHPATFDHSKASFQLTGAHITTTCALCHVNGIYTGTPSTCGNAGCHLTRYNATTNPKHSTAGFSIDCQPCHTTTAWVPSTFQHNTFFPISAGSRHSPGRWNLCSDCHTVATNFKVFSCIDCHEHSNKASVDAEHKGRSGYTYTSDACYRCHPRGNS